MDLSKFQWENRLFFLFSPHSDNALFKNLQDEISAQRAEIEDRDMVIFEILTRGPSRMDGNPLDQQSIDSIRNRFAAPRNDFSVILVGKDGGVKLKRDDRVKLNEILVLIDSMPMRKNEMRRKSHDVFSPRAFK